MHTLLDTNILLRSVQLSHVQHVIAKNAASALVQSGRTLCISSQTIYEFLAVATKPIAENGLAHTHAQADSELTQLLTGLEIIFDSPLVAATLRHMVIAHKVTGKKVHDCRLAAAMVVNHVGEILTFNIADFARFTAIVTLDPQAVAAGVLPPLP